MISENEYGFGTVGHTSVHHVVAGGWQGDSDQSSWGDGRLNIPMCAPGKRCSRRIVEPDQDKLCRACARALAAAERAAEEAVTGLPSLTNPEFVRCRVRLDDTFVDPRVQREEQAFWRKDISEHFDPAQFADDEPRLADRASCEGGYGPDGERYAILDHQHVIGGARDRGYPGSTEFEAKVYENKTLPEQAGVFRRTNNDRKAVKRLSDYRVALTQGDSVAVAVQAELDQRSLDTGPSGNDGKVACVGRLYLAYEKGVLDRVLDVIQGAWGNRSEAYQSYVFDALILLLTKARTESGEPAPVNDHHLVLALKKVNPVEVVQAYRNPAGYGRLGAARAANFIVTKYNTNLRNKTALGGFA